MEPGGTIIYNWKKDTTYTIWDSTSIATRDNKLKCKDITTLKKVKFFPFMP